MNLSHALNPLRSLARGRGPLKSILLRRISSVYSPTPHTSTGGRLSEGGDVGPQRRRERLLAAAAVGLSACFLGWSSSSSSKKGSRRICKCESRTRAGGSEVYVWGTNIDGQLGVGSALSVSLPALLNSLPLRPEETVIAVSGGPRHSACVTSEGRVFAWGRGAAADNRGSSSAEGPHEVVLPLQEGDKAISVSCGRNHSAVVTEMGHLYTWGANTHGQCGRPSSEVLRELDEPGADADCPVGGIGYRDVFRGRQSTASFLPPGRVGGPLASRKVIEASCGNRMSAAVTADGEIFVWGEARGDGLLNAVGSSEEASSYQPQEVFLPSEGPSGARERAVAIACGDGHLLALSTKGRVYAWGSNAYGQLGLGGSSRSVQTPQLVTALREHCVAAVACGSLHSLCLTKEGQVFVWGYGRDGQCAQGSRLDVPLPIEVEMRKQPERLLEKHVGTSPADGRCTHVSGGEGHSLAICEGGRLFMWGRGREGQLGRGGLVESPAASRDTPVEVSIAEGKRITAAACGGCHTIVCTT